MAMITGLIGGCLASLIGFYFGYRKGTEVGFIDGWNRCAQKFGEKFIRKATKEEIKDEKNI